MKLTCYYCAQAHPPAGRPHNPDMIAMFTCHDQRGCVHVCFEHAQWRMTTSWAFGHSRDCPHSEKH